MDRRQRKTREAIFSAFTNLIGRKAYGRITVNDIIEEADIGRATFYAHFETKDYLLREMCAELFGHIIGTAVDVADGRLVCGYGSTKDSVFFHLLRHIKENDRNILTLFLSPDNEIFMKYFKAELLKLADDAVNKKGKPIRSELPNDFTVNFIASTFAETVRWWISVKTNSSAEDVNSYFEAAVSSVIDISSSTQSCS